MIKFENGKYYISRDYDGTIKWEEAKTYGIKYDHGYSSIDEVNEKLISMIPCCTKSYHALDLKDEAYIVDNHYNWYHTGSRNYKNKVGSTIFDVGYKKNANDPWYFISTGYHNCTLKEFKELYDAVKVHNQDITKWGGYGFNIFLWNCKGDIKRLFPDLKLTWEVLKMPSRLNDDERVYIRYGLNLILLNNPDGFYLEDPSES